jgi:hypothetical protein
MQKTFIALLLTVTAANAEEQKPLATQAGESIAPYAQAFGETVSNTMMEFMAGGKGPLAEGARANLKMQDQRERAANRGTRKSMKECIKPENVIDDDVKECTEGLREKTW